MLSFFVRIAAKRSEVGEGGGESVFDLERYIGRGLENWRAGRNLLPIHTSTTRHSRQGFTPDSLCSEYQGSGLTVCVVALQRVGCNFSRRLHFVEARRGALPGADDGGWEEGGESGPFCCSDAVG